MLSMIMCIQNLVKFCPFILKILSKNQILTSINVANLRKMSCNNPNADLVNENVYAKFGQILSFYSQDIEQNPNDRMTARQNDSMTQGKSSIILWLTEGAAIS